MNWKKSIRIGLIALAAFTTLLVIAVVISLRTETFHRYLLARIVQGAEQSTGARIAIQKLDLRWSPFSADFYDVVVHGQEKSDQPPLLQAEHLGVTLGLRALLKKQVDIFAITVDHPVLHLQVDARGNSNLPNPPPSNSSSSQTVLVRHASLRDGTVNYNDRQIPLAAELDDFQAAVEFDITANKYRGALGYRRGVVVTSGMSPIEHAAQIQFVADSNGALVDPVIVASGKTRLTAHLNLANFASPAINGKYEAMVVTQELGKMLKNPSLPRGDISLAGTINYQSAANEPFLRAVRLAGRFDSRGLAIHTNQVSTSLQSIHGTFQLDQGNLRIQMHCIRIARPPDAQLKRRKRSHPTTHLASIPAPIGPQPS